MYTDSMSAQIGITTMFAILVAADLVGNTIVCLIIIVFHDMRQGLYFVLFRLHGDLISFNRAEMNNFHIFTNFVAIISKNEKKLDELRNYHFRNECQLSNTRITYSALRARKQSYYARRCSTLVLRSPNDVTQEAIRRLQDTLTNDCFRHYRP